MRQASVLIMDGDPGRRALHRERVSSSGHQVLAEAETQSQTLSLARALRPDLILLDVRAPTVAAWDVVRLLNAERNHALILVGDAAAAAAFWEATLPGVVGFFLDMPSPTDLQMALPLGLMRFRERIALEDELREMGERMEARKLVGRAKAILMERQNLSERDAFRRIQSQSLALNKPVQDIARAIITASEISGAAGTAPSRIPSGESAADDDTTGIDG